MWLVALLYCCIKILVQTEAFCSWFFWFFLFKYYIIVTNSKAELFYIEMIRWNFSFLYKIVIFGTSFRKKKLRRQMSSLCQNIAPLLPENNLKRLLRSKDQDQCLTGWRMQNCKSGSGSLSRQFFSRVAFGYYKLMNS